MSVRAGAAEAHSRVLLCEVSIRRASVMFIVVGVDVWRCDSQASLVGARVISLRPRWLGRGLRGRSWAG